MPVQIAIVGAGEMGRATARVLAGHLSDAHFHFFDRSAQNLAAAGEAVHAELHHVTIGADQPLALPRVELVMNFAGPFYLQSEAVARGALQAGAPYVDICDDVEGAEVILALDLEARADGQPLITGAGGSPGLSTLMAKHLVEQFNCTGIRIVWLANDSDPGGLAPLKHMLHMAKVPCKVWGPHGFDETPGFTPATRREYEFPLPIGSIYAFDTSHPEPITLARAFPRLEHISVQGALVPPWANDAFSMLARLGFGDDDLIVSIDGVEIEPARFLWNLLWARYNRKRGRTRPGYTAVRVIGLNGDDEVASYYAYDDYSMVRLTAIGAAAVALEMLENRPSPGAHGTEALEAQRVLGVAAELAKASGALPGGFVLSEDWRSVVRGGLTARS